MVRCTIFVFFLLVPAPSFADWFYPLPTYNQSPLVQIYGLPAPDAPRVLGPGQWQARISLEAANNFLSETSATETLTLDGETHRATTIVKYGTGTGEWGVELPYLSHGGGFLDGFVDNWHDVFGLPQGGRDDVPFDQLRFIYVRDGVERLRLTRANKGVGDIKLLAGWQLQSEATNDIALRASLKLPTGNAAELRGSGAADVALWLSAACVPAHCPAPLGWNASAGAVVLGSGDVLPALQRRYAVFGGAGLSYRPWQPTVFKAELRAHSPFYRHTDLTALGSTAIQLILGGTWFVDSSIAIDIGVSEDLRADTAPDVSILISLRANL